MTEKFVFTDNFGFTDNDNVYQRIVEFRDAAIQDGWDAKPTYPKTEPIETAASLSKDGFSMMILTRLQCGKWKYEATIAIWGPDGLNIDVPTVYSFKEITKGLRHCNLCGKNDVNTERFSFAGRCCAECLPEARKKHEYPGWAD